ncbi:GNAT family N-acetyltransferase [Deinococcus sp.]|uniref:GNAT family N-acetyltransferase n=1 Tax=Deinococcus sp. TaxID=47478 RepID=UPI003C79AFAD
MPDSRAVPPGLRFRPPRLPEDLGALAAVMSSAAPRFPMTPELLAERYAAADPGLQVAERVAEVAGEVVGVGGISQQDAHENSAAYWIRLWVGGPWQRRGVGRILLRLLEDEARRLGGRRLKGEVRQDVPGALALAGGGGYGRTWTRHESSLEITPERDFSGFDTLIAGLEAAGIVLLSISDLGGDPQRDRQLWELDWRLLNDVPLGMTLSRSPLEVWTRQHLQHPGFEPGLSFVALDPARTDPQTGPYIGLSSLERQPGDFYTIGMTGVLPAYRGRGVAKALKVQAMRALQERIRQDGVGGTIRTFNDPPNVAMLGMNAALGFERGPDAYRYERDLPELV